VPITSINYAAAEVSRHAVERILSMIGKPSPSPIVTLIDPELVIRQST